MSSCGFDCRFDEVGWPYWPQVKRKIMILVDVFCVITVTGQKRPSTLVIPCAWWHDNGMKLLYQMRR
jgi:hypothetical protein